MPNWVPKQTTWLTRFQTAVVALVGEADCLTELCNEYLDNGYGSGGADPIADSTVQSISSLQSQTALTVGEAEGVLAGANQILAIIAASRGYLENMRP